MTLREVARRATVHYATASTVLNGAKGSTRVSDETRRRVLDAASDLGYTANRAAQQLRTRRSRVVGLLTGGLENPFFARMVSLCSEALELEGCDMVLATRRNDERSDLHLLESLISRDLAGVILWSESLTEVRARLEQNGETNFAVMGMTIPTIDSVGAELQTGVEEALEHLKQQGYQRIGYFAPRFALNRIGDYRDTIYRRKMAEWCRSELIYPYDGTGSDLGAARVAAEELANLIQQQAPESRPDALLCFNDMNAFGAMMGFRRKGFVIPGDIALVGCDDLPMSRNLDVPLTTITYPLEAMCRATVGMLTERIRHGYEDSESKAISPRMALLQTHLVVRESSVRAVRV